MIFNIAPINPPSEQNNSPKRLRNVLFFGLIIFLAVAFLFSSDFLEFDANGRPILAPSRKAKMEKELDELDNSEQYALLASRDGDYPCFNCPGKSTIFLRQGMVWKYGATKKGELGRYGTWHIDNHLFYLKEFEGTWQECLRQEKLKIYNYATHPENLARLEPLIRPPGNKQDN